MTEQQQLSMEIMFPILSNCDIFAVDRRVWLKLSLTEMATYCTDTDLCPCGETQTMSHIVESCPPDKTEWWLISATLCE